MLFVVSVVIWYQETNKGDFMILLILFAIGYVVVWLMINNVEVKEYNKRIVEMQKRVAAAAIKREEDYAKGIRYDGL